MRFIFRIFLSFCLLLPSFPIQAEALEELLEPTADPPTEEVLEEEVLTEPFMESEVSPDPVIEDPAEEAPTEPAQAEDETEPPLPEEPPAEPSEPVEEESLTDPQPESEPDVLPETEEEEETGDGIPDDNAPEEIPEDEPPVEEPVEEPQDPPSESEEEPVEQDPQVILVPETFPQLVINEVLRGSETNPQKDHFIELYNPGEEEIELLDWQISGVTKGGSWIDITPDAGTAIQPNGYFVISHYTNSSSSVQSKIPGSIKSSILIPQGDIFIQIRDPQGAIIDTASIVDGSIHPIETETPEDGLPTYRSYERLHPFGGEWTLATARSNLKESVQSTFATPVAANSHYQSIGEVTELIYKLQIRDPKKGEVPLQPGHPVYDLKLSWNAPDHSWFSYAKLFQLDADFEDKTLLAEFTIPKSVSDENENPLFQEYLFKNIDPTADMTFHVTTVDLFGRESGGEYLTITPELRVVISEILPDPKTKETQNEFIELWNLSPFAVDLTGWELDDSNQEDNNSYFFVDEFRDYLLMPGEFIVFDRYETGINLSNEWDEVILYDAEGVEMDYYLYLSQPEGRSHARDPQNPEEWITLNHPTPGAPNIEFNQPPIPRITFQGGSTYMSVNVTGEDSYDLEGDDFTYFWEFGDGTTNYAKNPLKHTYKIPGEKFIRLTVTDEFGMSSSIKKVFNATLKEVKEEEQEESVLLLAYPSHQPINEFLPNPKGKDTEGEWIELFNSTKAVMDLSGWYLDDDEKGTSPHQLPENTLLKPGEYLVFYAPEVNLSLKNSDDAVRLLDPNKIPKQVVLYTGAQESQSYAKKADGSFAWTPLLTPGKANEFPLPPASFPFGSVIFQKILPNPDGKDEGLEKIVLKNTTSSKIDLSYWLLADDQNHKTVLKSLSIGPKAELTLSQSDFVFTLNNSEERLYLYDPAGNLIDQIGWKDAPSGQWVFDLDVFTDGMKVSVIRTIDGDTLDIDWQGHTFRIRLIGVDTPETVHPFKPVEFYGKKASDYLKGLLSNQTVTLKFDQNKMDKYGRLLAYVYLEDLFVNASIIQQGYGKAYTRFPFKYLNDFVFYQEQAKEAGLGMWEDEETALLIEEEMEKAIEEEIKEEEEMLEKLKEEGEEPEELFESMTIFEVKKKDEKEKSKNSKTKEALPLRDCSASELGIHSFMPYAEKDVSIEWIRIINHGSEKACLDGWKLDDIPDGGSKPFTLPSEWLEPGETRTFEKTETKISLNNKDDSVLLIHPTGEIADRIDYGKTHKNEIFTHAGGDWVPKARKSSKSSSGGAKKRFSFGREAIAYAAELANGTIVGIIENIDYEKQILSFKTQTEESKILSYKNTGLDFETLFLMLDSKEVVVARVYQTKDVLQLVDLEPFIPNKISISSSGLPAYLVFGFIVFTMGLLPPIFIRRKRML